MTLNTTAPSWLVGKQPNSSTTCKESRLTDIGLPFLPREVR